VHDTKPPFLEGFVVDMSKQVGAGPLRRYLSLQYVATHWWQPNTPLRCAARLSLFV
jgi:hypothetical protein